MKRKIIYIIGGHRSGSTWLAKILNCLQGSLYIHEPCNVDWFYGFHTDLPKRWFNFHEDIPRKKFNNLVETLAKGRPSLLTFFSRAYTLRELLRLVRAFVRGLFPNKIIIIKDPFLTFVSKLLLDESSHIFFLYRDPCGFVASIIKAGWTFPFREIIENTKLYDSLPEDIRDSIQDYCLKNEADLVAEGCILWNMYTWYYLEYLSSSPQVLPLYYDDLAQNGKQSVMELYSSLELDDMRWNDNSLDKLLFGQISSNDAGLMETSKTSSQVYRDWGNRLSEDQVLRIRRHTDSRFIRLREHLEETNVSHALA